MKTHRISTDEAQPWQKRGAFIDSQIRSAVNKSLYSSAQITAAIRMRDALEDCYRCSQVYKPNFGKTLVSVKVENPNGVKNSSKLKFLEAGWELLGYKKKESAQGILYSFKRV